MDKPKVLAVIGARSGSKSIPDKNIKPLLGKPLMGWIIEAAKQAKLVTKVVLSTDSAIYAEVGKQFGAEVPFLRPAEISTDTAIDIEYLTHAVEWYQKNEGWTPDIILRLPASSPLCTAESIDACIELLLNDPEATSARNVTEASKHPYKLWRLDPSGSYLIPFCPKEMTGYDEPYSMPRQLFPECLSHTDCIAVRYDTMMKDKSMSGPRTAFHRIAKTDAVDIDTITDFYLAEILLKQRLERKI